MPPKVAFFKARTRLGATVIIEGRALDIPDTMAYERTYGRPGTNTDPIAPTRPRNHRSELVKHLPNHNILLTLTCTLSRRRTNDCTAWQRRPDSDCCDRHRAVTCENRIKTYLSGPNPDQSSSSVITAGLAYSRAPECEQGPRRPAPRPQCCRRCSSYPSRDGWRCIACRRARCRR